MPSPFYLELWGLFHEHILDLCLSYNLSHDLSKNDLSPYLNCFIKFSERKLKLFGLSLSIFRSLFLASFIYALHLCTY